MALRCSTSGGSYPLITVLIGKWLIQTGGAVFFDTFHEHWFSIRFVYRGADRQNLSCAPKERVLFVNVATDSLRIKRADGVVLSHSACHLDARAGYESRDDFCIGRRA